MLPGMAHRPLAASVLWPDSTTGPWRVTVWWRVQYGVPTPVGLDLRAWDAPAAAELPGPDDDAAFPQVEGVVLRRLPMTELLEQTRRQVQQQLAAGPALQATGDDERTARQAAAMEQVLPGSGYALRHFEVPQAVVDAAGRAMAEQAEAFSTRKGNRDLGDAHYREVARIYAEAVQTGRPPTLAVAEWLAGDSARTPEERRRAGAARKSAAAKQVARARDRGFLPRTTRGRVGKLEETP